MTHSRVRLTLSIAGATASVAGLVLLIASSQVAVGLFPVVGIGGMVMDADAFDGRGVDVYPVKGDIPGTTDSVTDTTACEERPMVAFSLQGAVAQDYALYKDIRVPYFSDQWVTIKLVETDGGTVQGESLTLYTTQMFADTATFTNVRLAEGGPDPTTRSTEKFGPRSGEFLLTVDPEDSTAPDANDLQTTGVTAWIHAMTGEQVTFTGNTSGLINLQVDHVSTSDIESRYSNLAAAEHLNVSGRRGYFDCLPTAP